MRSPANESRRTAWTPLVAYFLLAFGITWLLIIAFLASRSFEFDTITMSDGLLLFGFMCLGPSTAGLVMTARAFLQLAVGKDAAVVDIFRADHEMTIAACERRTK